MLSVFERYDNHCRVVRELPTHHTMDVNDAHATDLSGSALF
jgi:hypothetical protein